MKPTFFATASGFRKWLRRHHQSEKELWVGFYRKQTGRPSLTWQESVDEALCVGWIDGIRKKIDDESYKIRFTPRRRGSIWSAINIKRAEALTNEKRMQPAGSEAFARRREKRSMVYSYEQRKAELPEPYLGRLRKTRQAFAYFEAQPPSYRKMAVWWVVSAKQQATRDKRFEKLQAASAEGRRL